MSALLDWGQRIFFSVHEQFPITDLFCVNEGAALMNLICSFNTFISANLMGQVSLRDLGVIEYFSDIGTGRWGSTFWEPEQSCIVGYQK